MVVCRKCLMAIECHEGRQIHRHLSWEDFTEEELTCEWCDEKFPIDEMVEI